METAIRKEMTLLIRALYFSLEEYWSKLTRSYHISTAQQHVLFILYNYHPITVSQIGKIGCWHISTVSRLLQPLIKNRYVTIFHDETNQKVKFVALTDTGKKLLDDILTTLVNAEDFPFDFFDYPKEEIDIFLKLGIGILQKQKGMEFANWIKESELSIH